MGTQHRIGGCQVSFPHVPYGVQLCLMAKLIQALNDEDNALLEAPTGSGKTLSLLCSALAWQQKRRREIAEMHTRRAVEHAEAGRREAEAAAGGGGKGQSHGAGGDPSGLAGSTTAGAAAGKSSSVGAGAGPSKWGQGSSANIPKLPRIFYATRTHSQIAQVVRELKRTPYKPSMAILASRTQYCINKAVVKSGRIDEECESLMKDGFGCRFHSKFGRGAGVPGVGVHDIEDLAK
ncbi:hypothetical protein FOA52_004078 [Chlamydomonas sp. UWO 241]|nr:hypothetical protein FOA52_004078 [Chlamydomonas sp. UWO 241]